MPNPKFKRSESFYIRDGWFQKAIHAIHDSHENVFSGTKGVDALGIGSNMVKGLKYWLLTSGVLKPSSTKSELTEFGRLLFECDPYLETTFSWFLIHYNILSRPDDAPIFDLVFNDLRAAKFEKQDMENMLIDRLKEVVGDLKEEYVKDDLGVFLKSYTVEDKDGDPEDNYICPLSALGLLEKKGKDSYVMRRPRYGQLSYLIVYFVLKEKYGKQFNIEDALHEKGSPVPIFNLDKNMFLQYLDEMRKGGLVTINKTAGLNTVYLEREMSLAELFTARFGG